MSRRKLERILKTRNEQAEGKKKTVKKSEIFENSDMRGKNSLSGVRTSGLENLVVLKMVSGSFTTPRDSKSL